MYPLDHMEKYHQFKKNINLNVYETNGTKYQINKKTKIYCFFFEHSLGFGVFLCMVVKINIINTFYTVIFRAIFWSLLGALTTAISLRLLVKELEENKIS